MKDDVLTTILCKSKGEDGYTIADFKEDMKNGDKESLADFIYKRFSERYILPFESIADTKKKNGFSIMAVACLMIEALESFYQGLEDTKKISKDCFKSFFSHCEELKAFKGLEFDFYKNVRCGILHQAETRSGWKIRRLGELLEKNSKTINATEFLKQLKKYLIRYSKELKMHDLKDDIWLKFKKKMDAIIGNCYPKTTKKVIMKTEISRN